MSILYRYTVILIHYSTNIIRTIEILTVASHYNFRSIISLRDSWHSNSFDFHLTRRSASKLMRYKCARIQLSVIRVHNVRTQEFYKLESSAEEAFRGRTGSGCRIRATLPTAHCPCHCWGISLSIFLIDMTYLEEYKLTWREIAFRRRISNT